VAFGVASEYDFSAIGTGVYTAPSDCLAKAEAEQSLHAMVACGYGTDAVTGMDYWLVKNSWGPTWGDNGYIKIQAGKDVCGIESSGVSWPTLDMSKTTDVSNLCVNDKACTKDSDCNAIANSCQQGKCVCDVCMTNKVCGSDADCNGIPGSCNAVGDQSNGTMIKYLRQVSSAFNFCDCRTGCINGRVCTTDTNCAGVLGACISSGMATTSDGGKTWTPYNACQCTPTCVQNAQCSGDVQCGGATAVVGSCGANGWADNNGNAINTCNCS